MFRFIGPISIKQCWLHRDSFGGEAIVERVKFYKMKPLSNDRQSFVVYLYLIGHPKDYKSIIQEFIRKERHSKKVYTL